MREVRLAPAQPRPALVRRHTAQRDQPHDRQRLDQDLRRSLAGRTVGDVVTLLSMLLGDAVDEGLIGANPCRRLRIDTGDHDERPHASPWQVRAIAQRCCPTMAAQTKASSRTVHLPPFLVDQLSAHRAEQNQQPQEHVFTGLDGGLLRRTNFRRRIRLSIVGGDTRHGWAPILPGLHFHDLRHTYKTWLTEDGRPEVLQHRRLEHWALGIRTTYSHVTSVTVDAMPDGLQHRWERSMVTPTPEVRWSHTVVLITPRSCAPFCSPDSRTAGQ